MGGKIKALYGVSFSPMVKESGQLFNIVIGQDLNGDNQFDDRPAFTSSDRADVLHTRWGAFDLIPSANQARIPLIMARALAIQL